MKLCHKRKTSFLVIFNLAVIGIVIVVAFSISLLFFYQMYQANARSATNSLDNDLRQINQTLSDEIESLYHVTNHLADDVQLSQAVESYYGGDLSQSVQGKKMINYILSNALSLSTSAENISLLCGDQILQVDRYSLEKPIDFTRMKQDLWYGQLMSDEIPFAFGINTDYATANSDQKQYYFCATKFKSKFYQNRGDENRIVVVTFRVDTDQLTNMAAQYGINILLYNGADGRILCRAGVDTSFHDLSIGWDGVIGEFDDFNREFIMLSQTNPLCGWELRGFVRRTTYMAMASPVQGGLLLLLALLLFLDIIFSVTVVRNISKPLQMVIKGMEDISNQDFYILRDRGRYSEIDKLVTTFNRMSDRIRELIHNIAREEQEKRKMEFRVLENQINPHFLYNTLDATRWVALMNNDKATADIIGSLSRLLQISLSGGREMIPVRQEIELTQEYANIMVFRNNYSVSFDYQIEPDVDRLLTLKLVLQPLVENCFVHAFSPEQSDARICIRCFRQDAMLVMMVIDNGSGLSHTLSEPQRDPRLTGIGIHNIEERLRLWYGPRFGLRIESPPSGGTTVVITQPLNTQEGGEGNDSGHAG